MAVRSALAVVPGLHVQVMAVHRAAVIGLVRGRHALRMPAAGVGPGAGVLVRRVPAESVVLEDAVDAGRLAQGAADVLT